MRLVYGAIGVVASIGTLGGCSSDDAETTPAEQPVAQTLFVAHEGVFSAYDLATGTERMTPVTEVAGPYGTQALDDGTILTNLTDGNAVLAVDGKTLREASRGASSSAAGKRPVDAYLSAEHDGKRYWLALNDGSDATAHSSSATLFDLTAGSASRFAIAGEVELGAGHHQGAFGASGHRFVATNFFDCENVASVYDFEDPASITALLTISAADLGFDGSTAEKTCDAAESVGVAMRPHGCATSAKSKKTYCNLSGPGVVVAIDTDANPPAFSVITTTGKGGGYVKAGEGGDYVYTVQNTPGETSGGADCQIGQLLTIDTSTDAVVHETPLFYDGPGCTRKLTGTDEESPGNNHIRITPDGKSLFIALAGGFGNDAARVRRHLAIDLSDPAAPVQLASIVVGTSGQQRGSAITGDGKWLLVADTLDDTVSVIDVATREVTRKIAVHDAPKYLATFGTAEGPSVQIGPVH